MSIISKKARYALHGIGYIAVFSKGRPVPFDEILAYLRDYSQRLTLSPGYIAKIFQELSRAGLTAAASGPHGGYQIARSAEKIRLIEIVEALDGPLLRQCCLLSVGDCPRQSTCGVRTLIGEAELVFYRFFEKQTVASLAHRMAFPASVSSRARRRAPLRATRRNTRTRSRRVTRRNPSR